jgi:hypothetical protein
MQFVRFTLLRAINIRRGIVSAGTNFWREPMPQVWATFEEIATLYQIDVTSARSLVIHNQWERRRYSDGVTRAILPPDVALKLMIDYATRPPSPDCMSDHVNRAESCSLHVDESSQVQQMAEQQEPEHDRPARTFPRTTIASPHQLHALGKPKLTRADHRRGPRHLERPVFREAPALRSFYAVVQARSCLMSAQLAA